MKEREYIAVIGDIHDSRLIENRNRIQKKLQKILEKINVDYKNDIASAFSISMGDSLQGLLEANSSFVDILSDIEMSMFPIEIRFGIGIGTIATSLNRENSQLNDGPAYHRARKTMERIEQMEKQYATRKTNTLLLSAEEETMNDRLVNAIFSLNTEIKSKWTNRQKEIIIAYIENNENQYETASALDMGQSGVSKALKNTHFYAVKSSLQDIQAFMNTRFEGETDHD